MIIVCTSVQLDEWTADVDRECDVWYEKDYTVQGQYAVMIYPKLYWKPVDETVILISGDEDK